MMAASPRGQYAERVVLKRTVSIFEARLISAYLLVKAGEYARIQVDIRAAIRAIRAMPGTSWKDFLTIATTIVIGIAGVATCPTGIVPACVITIVVGAVAMQYLPQLGEALDKADVQSRTDLIQRLDKLDDYLGSTVHFARRIANQVIAPAIGFAHWSHQQKISVRASVFTMGKYGPPVNASVTFEPFGTFLY